MMIFILYNFAAITYKNQDNIGGIASRIYFAETSDLATVPTRAAFSTITTPASAAMLTGSFSCKTGKQFFPIDITLDKGSLEVAGVGEVGGKSTKPALKFQTDGLDETMAGLLRLFQNGRFVFIIPNLNAADNFQVIGIDEPAQLKDGKLTTGEGIAGKRGMECSFECGALTLYFATITSVQLATLIAPAV